MSLKRDKLKCPTWKNVLSQELFCLWEQQLVVDSEIVTFSVKCQSIILNKYQTYLTVTLIWNAALSKSLHRKIYEYVREVVTIHKNHNHEKYFPELHFSIWYLFTVSVCNLVCSENHLSAKVILPKKWIILHFKPALTLIITHHHLPKSVVFLKNSANFIYFFAIINQEGFAIFFKDISEKLLLSKSYNLKKGYLDVFYLDVHSIWETNIKL